MTIFPKSLEEKFLIFALLFYTRALYFESLFILPEGLLEQGSYYNPLSPILSLIQHSIFLITLFLLSTRCQKTFRVIYSNKLLWTFVIFSLLSFLWSDFADLTLRRSFSLLETTIFGVYFAVSCNLKKQINLLASTLFIVIVLNFLFTFVFSGNAIETGIHTGAWRGVFIHKNLMSRLMVLASLVFLFLTPKNALEKYTLWIASFLAGMLVMLSTSKTGLVVLFLLLLLVAIIFLTFRMSDLMLIPFLLTISLFIGTLITWLINNTETILVSLGKNPNLSGRTILWSALRDKIQERPWLGYGYDGFWHQMFGESAYVGKVFGTTYLPPHSHNGFIELILAFGFIGALLLGLNFLTVIRRSLITARLTSNREGLFPLIYLGFFLLYNLTESSMVEHNSIFWIIYITLASSRFLTSEDFPRQPDLTKHHSNILSIEAGN